MKGFTFIELLVVLIIVGILSALSLPNFTKTRERALDKEAQLALRLIYAAERIYRVKENSYYPFAGSASQAQLNAALQLDLTSQSWQYGITSGGATAFTARALRNVVALNPWERTWWFRSASTPPLSCNDGSSTTACPPPW